MLRDLTYKNIEIEKEITNLIGKEYSFLNKIKKGGVGSARILIKRSDNDIYSLLNVSNDLNECNIELREKGIIIYFKSKQSTYGLAISFYKLTLFKVDNNHYTISYEKYFLKLRIKKSSDHKFFKKISEDKAFFLESSSLN